MFLSKRFSLIYAPLQTIFLHISCLQAIYFVFLCPNNFFQYFSYPPYIMVRPLSCKISIHYEHQKSCYFNIYFREFTVTTLFQGLAANGRKCSLRVKNTSRLEIIITVSIENHAKSSKNFGLVFRGIFYADNIISK